MTTAWEEMARRPKPGRFMGEAVLFGMILFPVCLVPIEEVGKRGRWVANSEQLQVGCHRSWKKQRSDNWPEDG